MNFRLKKLASALMMLGTASITMGTASEALAQGNTAASSEQQMKALAAKTEELQKQLVALQKQIAELKQQKQNTETKASPTGTSQNDKPANSTEAAAEPHESALTVRTVGNDEEGDKSRRGRKKSMRAAYYPTALIADGKVLTYLAGTPVVTSPYLGDRPAFDGSDLIINISKINQDIRLMEQRNNMEQFFTQQGYPVPDTPIVTLSGKLEPFAYWQKPYSGPSTGDMDLGSAELDAAAILNPWVEGLISFVYDSSYPADGGQRVANSNVTVDKAFVNIGNPSKTPFYMTAGQVYVPFGQYSSNMVTSPMILSIGRTEVRSTMFGFIHPGENGFYGTVFAYKSNSTDGQTAAGGGNLVYDFGNDDIDGNIGASIISNIGDSAGMQSTGMSTGEFQGFGFDSSTEDFHQVPGYDFHGAISFGPYNILGEFVSSVRKFDADVLSYNGAGAQPMGVNVEGARTFKFLGKPAAFALGYGWTGDALALGLPQQRYSAVLNVSWWRDTIESLEYRHDVDYGSSNSASGLGSTDLTMGSGHSADTITAQLGVYF